MAETYTSNLGLVKPDYDSPADISVINSNMDKIDNAVANAGKVKSVNGKTGDVTLTAADVGARPADWMPTAADVGALPSDGTAANATQLNGNSADKFVQADIEEAEDAGDILLTNADLLAGKSLAQIMLMMYPVGAIYTSTVETSPAALFGGTWESIGGRFLLGADGTYPAGSTGGEAECSLEMENLPSDPIGITAFNASPDSGFSTANYAVSTLQVHEYYPNGFGTGVANGTYLSMISIGQDAPHNNMPPYLSVYMWKRTA